MQFGGKFWATRFDNPTAKHDVCLERDVVFEQLLVMGDDENAHLSPTNPGNTFAGKPHRIGIEATVGFVENGKAGPEHCELKDFSPLHLAARKAIIDIPSGEVTVHRQFLHLVLQFTSEFPHRHQFLPLLAVGVADIRYRVAEEVGKADARNCHWPLECQKDADPGATIRLHLQDVMRFAVGIDQFNRATRDFIRGMPHDGVTKRALA